MKARESGKKVEYKRKRREQKTQNIKVYINRTISIIVLEVNGTWLAQSVKCLTLDLRVVSLSPVLGSKNINKQGCLGGSAVWCLPLAEGVILETRDRVPHQAPCMEPASPSACVSASLSLSLSLSLCLS